MSERIPDWVLERVLAGELPPGISEQDLAKDPSVPERLEALRRDNAAILERHAPAAVAREIHRRAERTRAARPPVKATVLRLAPVLAVASLAVLIVPALLPREEVRTKGLAAHLEIYRQRGALAEKLSPEASAREGDVLQLKIVGAADRFAAVLSIDGAGSVTLHAPEREGASLELPPNGVQTLAHAYALDAAPRFERFVLVSSPQPFDVTTVMNAAHAIGPEPSRALPLPAQLHQSSFVVRKIAAR